MSRWPGHLAISASAGTGKTYRLALRFIQLIMLGEAPERIVALTFSRKAAGEIFDRVVKFLVTAAGSDAEAIGMNKRIGLTGGKPADYLAALRRLLEALPRSRVGTIDSFTVGVVRSFPYELGLDPDFDVFDSEGLDAAAHRRAALRSVLLRASAGPTERESFLKVFNDATFGHDEKQAGRLLEELVGSFQRIYRLQPDARHWGIPPVAGGAAVPSPAVLQQALARLRDLADHRSPGEYSRGIVQEFCDEVEAWSPEQALGGRTKYMLEKVGEEHGRLGSVKVTLKLNREELVLKPEDGAALRLTIDHLVSNAIALAAHRSRGLFQLAERYEQVYDEQVRRRGFLTFDDALYSLAGRRLSSGGGDPVDPNRLAIDYRMDARLDHWLLDEFQDTSSLQWQVMSGLIDEVVQDHDQRRTFFYVGDVKQAIYGWRGGNAELFSRILDHYNRTKPAIKLEFSNVSYRSARPVIDTVNRVFRALPEEAGEGAVKQWSAAWKDHDCADGVVPANGYAAWIEQAKDAAEADDAETRRFQAAVDLVAAVDPLGKGLSAAILTRGNNEARVLAEIMRARHPHLPVALEGRSQIADNPAVSLLLNLLQWASHPSDTLARRFLQMSPLAAGHDFGETSRLPTQILAEVQGGGFLRTLSAWVGILQDRVGPTDYERLRIRQLLELASAADADPVRDIDYFVDQAREASVEDAASRRAVRIMTIHKSKGLDFDMVVLPDLQGRGGPDTGALVQWDADRSSPEWILQYVNKTLAAFDPRLSRCLEEAATRRQYEDLCVLYVAMTRAARALYLLTTSPGPKSVAKNHRMILRHSLSDGEPGPEQAGLDGLGIPGAIVYEAGDRRWHQGLPDQPAPPREDPSPIQTLSFGGKADGRAMPSAGVEFERRAGKLFASSMRRSREWGIAVHACFESIEWLDGEMAAPRAARTGDPAAAHVAGCLKNPEVAALFRRPDEPCEVWREQSFEILLEGEWISGVFDRVAIRRDAQGHAIQVDIIDFKTNRIDGEERIRELTDHYRSQLESYRAVLSRLLDLPASSIRMILVFTEAPRVVVL